MSTYLSFNSDANKYSSRRSVVYGKNGMVCTSQTLAAQAGLDILKNGGNAIDAAIATAISLTVLEPPSNGIGSDLFALVWYKGNSPEKRYWRSLAWRREQRGIIQTAAKSKTCLPLTCQIMAGRR